MSYSIYYPFMLDVTKRCSKVFLRLYGTEIVLINHCVKVNNLNKKVKDWSSVLPPSRKIKLKVYSLCFTSHKFTFVTDCTKFVTLLYLHWKLLLSLWIQKINKIAVMASVGIFMNLFQISLKGPMRIYIYTTWSACRTIDVFFHMAALRYN